MTGPASAPGRAGLLRAAREELVEHGHASISLRAVARRAGVSHAAPKYHFEDRAALLTAVAAEGYRELAVELRQVAGGSGSDLTALGQGYVDFGLANPALFDLMFRPNELHPEDAELAAAQAEAIGILAASIDALTGGPAQVAPAGRQAPLTLVAWALVHGLVVLAGDGALNNAAALSGAADVARLAHDLVAAFTRHLQPLDTVK